MASLRKTIRKILLENQHHYEKLATLICSEDLENIHQAFELASSIEAVGHIEYVQEPDHRHPHLYITHNWTITGGYDPAFLEALKDIIYSATWGLRPRNTYLRFTPDTFVLSLKEDSNRR